MKRYICLLLAVLLLAAGLTGCGEEPAPSGDTVATTTTTKKLPDGVTLQMGGATFTLDGETFEMGVSPDKLLAHLGEPQNVIAQKETILGGIRVTYLYEQVVVETFSPHAPQTEPVALSEAQEQVISSVYFRGGAYTFDGVKVGDTAEKLDADVSAYLPPTRSELTSGYRVSGPAYRYDADPADLVFWFAVFSGMESEQMNDIRENGYVVPPTTEIRNIIVSYNYVTKYSHLLR